MHVALFPDDSHYAENNQVTYAQIYIVDIEV